MNDSQACPPASDNTGIFRLLDLPLELRRRIYYYCIPTNLLVRLGPSAYLSNRPRFWVDLRHLPPEKRRRRHQEQDGWLPGVNARHNWERNDGSEDFEDEGELDTQELDFMASFTHQATTGTSAEGEGALNPRPYPQSGLDDYSDIDMLKQPTAWLYAPPHRSAMPNLLLVSRAITQEVTDMMCANNTFLLWCPMAGRWRDCDVWTPATQRKVRKIILRLDMTNVLADEDSPLLEPWSDAFKSVQILGMVLEDGPPRCREREAFFIELMQRLDALVPKEAYVYVDTNAQTIVKLIDQAIPSRKCIFQPLNIGDDTFLRRHFDPKTSRWNCVRDIDY